MFKHKENAFFFSPNIGICQFSQPCSVGLCIIIAPAGISPKKRNPGDIS